MGLLMGTGETTPQFPLLSWYGIKINIKHGGKDTTDGKLERVGNLDLHRSLPIQSKIKRFMANVDGTVNYWLDQNDSTKKEGGGEAYLNAVDGNVMLYKPPYWRKIEIQGDYMIVAISEVELPGFMYMKARARSPWLATFDRRKSKAVSASFLQWDERGEILRNPDTGFVEYTDNAVYYRGGNNDGNFDNKPGSLLGMPATSLKKYSIRDACKNVGDKWHFGGWRFREEISWLFAIEYGTLDSQAEYNPNKTAEGFNQGGLSLNDAINTNDWYYFNYYNAFIPNGITAKFGNSTVVFDYTVKNWVDTNDLIYKVSSYRGFEMPLVNINEFCDDVNCYFGKSDNPLKNGILYICEDHTKFVDCEIEDNIPDYYEKIGEIPESSGYISVMWVNKWTYPQSITGGGQNKSYCDRVDIPPVDSFGWFNVERGTPYHFTNMNGGFFANYIRNRFDYSYAFIGFPLCLEIE